MNTVRRDKIFRLIQTGKLVAVGSYHYDDMDGQSIGKFAGIPVAAMPADFHDRKEGVFYVFPSDFTTKSGYAYLSEDRMTCHVGVHGNCNYDFRMADGSAFSNGEGAATATAYLPENQRMQAFLAANGITATPKYFHKGSLRGYWRLYNSGQRWTMDLANKLNGLGFVGTDNEPLDQFAGNGGAFCVFVRGHNEFLQA